MNLWGGRFTGSADQHFAEYNASFRFDQRLLFADLKGCQVQAQSIRESRDSDTTKKSQASSQD